MVNMVTGSMDNDIELEHWVWTRLKNSSEMADTEAPESNNASIEILLKIFILASGCLNASTNKLRKYEKNKWRKR